MYFNSQLGNRQATADTYKADGETLMGIRLHRARARADQYGFQIARLYKFPARFFGPLRLPVFPNMNPSPLLPFPRFARLSNDERHHSPRLRDKRQ